MRTYIYLLFFFFGVSTCAFAQSSAMPASKGIYLKLGDEFPTTFRYVVQRKADRDVKWSELTETTFPNSSAMLKGRLMTAPAVLLQGQRLSDTTVKVLWRRAEGALMVDSIRPYNEMPLYATALGISYLDTSAVPGSYQYRILRRNANDVNLDSTVIKINYAPTGLRVALIPVEYEVKDEAIAINYYYSGKEKLAGIKLLRSRFGYKQFEQVPAFVLFNADADSVIRVTDQTASYKGAYQYLAIPFDGLGNEGPVSDTLYVYNNSRAHDIGFFKTVKATPVTNAIKLSWTLASLGDVKAIKVFKSLSWDGDYLPVATVLAKDTSFLDTKVRPMVTYYYRLQAQGPYSSSLPSSRFQALMKTPRQNIFPPQKLTAAANGSLVTLKFAKADYDTRGYYVYRRNGYAGKAVQLGRILLDTSANPVYIDTLSSGQSAGIFTYQVASINTSYVIGPLSNPASVTISGQIPIPSKVDVRFAEGRAIVFWKDEISIAGYTVYRSEKLETENKYGEMKPIAELLPSQNSFADSSLIEGKYYSYQIQCKGLGNNGDDKGGLSNTVTVHYNSQKLNAPSQVLVAAQTNDVLISWTNPIGVPLTKVRIYRAKADGEFTLLKELAAELSEYIDTTATADQTFFYAISVIDSRGKESKQTEPVGVRINK